MDSGHLQSNLWYHMGGGTKALIFGSKIKYEFRTKFSHPRPNQIWPWSAPEMRGGCEHSWISVDEEQILRKILEIPYAVFVMVRQFIWESHLPALKEFT